MRGKLLAGLFILASSGAAVSQEYLLEFSDPVAVKGDVNSYAEESYPFFTGNNIFYYVRTFHQSNEGGAIGGQDIWKSTPNRQYTNFVSSTNKLGELNNDGNNAIVGISDDGSKVYLLNIFSTTEGTKPGFSVAAKTGDGWGTPQSMNVPTLNISGDYYSAHVCKNGEMIFISMSALGSFGGHDIYVMYKTDAGWTSPINIGKNVNTSGEEMSPYYHEKLGILFFSSNGLGGASSQDIFYVQHMDENDWTSWSEVRKITGPVNSGKFEGYFTCNGDSICAFASSRNTPLADIYLTNMRVKEVNEITTTHSSVVIHDTVVIVDTIYQTFVVEDENTHAPLENKITNFEYNQAAFNKKDMAVIDTMIYYLTKNPELKIRVSGHTCDLGSEDYNVTLSKERAESVKDALIERGVAESRIIVKWYGSSKPVAPNDSEANRKKNRRVELDLLVP